MGQFTDKTNFNDSLDETLQILGIEVDEPQKQQLKEYSVELLRWNKRVNLTGASDETALVKGPLFDALTLVPVLEPSGTLVDVGSGGGLPGIPVALIFPDLKLTLIEPRSRRATFLKHVCHKFSLDAEVVQCKEKELKAGQWQGAIAQAVWPPVEWIPRGARLVCDRGTVYVLSSKEVTEALLPPNVVIEKRFFIERPMDRAPRHAVRIRCG